MMIKLLLEVIPKINKMFPNTTKIGILIVLVILAFTVFANVGWTQDTIMEKSPESCNCENPSDACKQYCGDYELRDFVILAIRISKWILGIVGSLALAFFIYGGVTMLISAGNKERVAKARTILVNAVIGLVIVFASWAIINFVYTALDVEDKETWHQVP